MWHLSENGKPRGQFDLIIIACNGDKMLLPLLFLSQQHFIVLKFCIKKMNVFVNCSGKMLIGLRIKIFGRRKMNCRITKNGVADETSTEIKNKIGNHFFPEPLLAYILML